jgi:hypothetical protein
MTKLPNISAELIEYLEGIAPDQAPKLKTPDREIWFNAGKADLVQHLKQVHEQQTQTILGDT